MLKKIIKGSHRKPSKSDSYNPGSIFDYGQPVTRNFGSVSTANVVVNHASRAGPPPPPSNSSGPGPISLMAFGPPPSGLVDPLPLFRDVPISERQSLFIRKLQICCFQFDFSDTLQSAREKEIKRQSLMELVDFIQSAREKSLKLAKRK